MSWISGAYDVIIHGPYLKRTQLLFMIWRHYLWTACPCLSLSTVVSIGVSLSTEHEFALARVQIWKSVHSIEIFSIWPQASKQASRHTHARVQCSHASVGLAQARPNQNGILKIVDAPLVALLLQLGGHLDLLIGFFLITPPWCYLRLVSQARHTSAKEGRVWWTVYTSQVPPEWN